MSCTYIDSHYVFEMQYLAQCYDCEFQFKFQVVFILMNSCNPKFIYAKSQDHTLDAKVINPAYASAFQFHSDTQAFMHLIDNYLGWCL